MNHRDILQKLNDTGHQAYIVGGAVRDKLLNLPVKDHDLTTSATVDQIVSIFNHQATVLHSRSNAPVVNVAGYELASFRKERGTRHEAQFEAGTILDDAERRDLTVNALYEDLNGNIIDPRGLGLLDLASKTLRIMTRANGRGMMQRLIDDPTRIFRMYRLSAQLGFDIDEYSRKVVVSYATGVLYNGLGLPADEQIGRELRKLLTVEDGKQVSKAIFFMHQDLVLDLVSSDLADMWTVEQGGRHQEGNVLTHTLMAIERTKNDPVLRMAALYHDTGKKATQAPNKNGEGYSFHGHEKDSTDIVAKDMKRLKSFNSQEMESVKFLVSNHMRMHEFPNMSRKKQADLLRHKDASRLIDLLKADTLGRIPCANSKLQDILGAIDSFYSVDKTLTDLGITGKLLVSLGEEPGPKLGLKLQKMDNILTKNPGRSKEELLKAIGLSLE